MPAKEGRVRVRHDLAYYEALRDKHRALAAKYDALCRRIIEDRRARLGRELERLMASGEADKIADVQSLLKELERRARG